MMKRFTKLLSLLLAILMIAPLTNAAFADGTFSVVRIQIGADIGSTSPWASDGGGRMAVMPNIYETLCYQRTFGGEALPLLAESYEKISNTVIKITLHDDIYDTAGNHITAEDVVFSYETDIAEGNQASYVGSVGSIKALDDYSIELELSNSGVGALEDTLCAVRIVSKKAYNEDNMSANPIGTGPYILKEWVTGSSVTLARNENYWNADDRAEVAQANVDEIVYKVISEPAQILVSLENGEIDYTGTISNSDIHHFLDGGDLVDQFVVESVPASLSQCVFFNCSEGNPFADVRLRQAVCYAIDNEAVLDGAYDSLGSVCHAFGSEKSSDYQSSWKNEEYYEYNPEKAIELMADAGYADGLEVRLLCDAASQHTMMAQIIQLYLSEIGINVTINSYDDALFNTYRYDPTQWDIHINNKAGAYVVQQWQYSLDAKFFNGSTCNWLVDEKWQELYETASSIDTHTPENMDAAWQYLKEIDPVYAVCFSYNYFVGAKCFDSFYLTDKDNIMPGACTYVK